MQFFDTHAHIGLIYEDPIEQLRVIQQAKQAGVTRIVSINNSLHDFKKVYPNIKSMPGVYHAIGVAPVEVTNPGKNWIQTIEEGLKLPNVIAVGECGLDYYKQFGDKRMQTELFITQLEIAKKCLEAGLNVYFSFAGNLTYRNAHNLHETVLNIPHDRILIETESPFMVPAEFRERKRAMPAYLPSTARFLSEMLEIDLEELSKILWTNSCKIFRLPEA